MKVRKLFGLSACGVLFTVISAAVCCSESTVGGLLLVPEPAVDHANAGDVSFIERLDDKTSAGEFSANEALADANSASMWLLLTQRDFAGVRAYLRQRAGAFTALDKLLQLELDLRERQQVDSDALRTLQNAHAGHAELQFRAGALWLQYVRQSNFFARRALLGEYIRATIRAAELAPENSRYLVAAGIAAGQPSILGGDPDRQVQLVNNWRGTDPADQLRARMDLAQNQQNRREGERLMAAALALDAANLLLRARVANLAWTYDMDAQAQGHFSAVCDLHPADSDHEWEEWLAACENAASLAADGAGDRSQTRLLLAAAITRAPQGLKPELAAALALLD